MNNMSAIANVTPRRSGRAVVRLSGDSGDGIQLLGTEFTKTAGASARGFITFADFPAEIRAPVGTTYGVSAYQIQFGGPFVLTVGDEADVLVAFNAAALKTNLEHLRPDGLLIIDPNGFGERDIVKAGLSSDPRSDNTLSHVKVLEIDMSRQAREVGMRAGVTRKEADRTKNFWALGLLCWMFDHALERTIDWIARKFAGNDALVDANIAALKAGYVYGDVTEISGDEIATVATARAPGEDYRAISGNDALVYGLAAAAYRKARPVCFCSYPITPASSILHGLAKLNTSSVRTFQAEDEIAAACAAIGASFGGAIGVTASSGPGIALKAEAMGLAVAAELPLVVINVQRAGPSTGMPTKTEQADLAMALHGRHAEAPLFVLAPATPADCFDIIIQAVELACTYMTPVMVLSDGYIANASEPWRVPDVDSIAMAPIRRVEKCEGAFRPFERDPDTLARPWAVPGMMGFEHRIGGLERSLGAGNISYDGDNHQKMTDLRREKVENAAASLPAAKLERGPSEGKLLIVGWGSTYGPIGAAVDELTSEGHAVAHLHMRQISPLPRGLKSIFEKFDNVMVAEMNSGQLRQILRSTFLIPAHGLSQITGKPFKVSRIKQEAIRLMES